MSLEKPQLVSNRFRRRCARDRGGAKQFSTKLDHSETHRDHRQTQDASQLSNLFSDYGSEPDIRAAHPLLYEEYMNTHIRNLKKTAVVSGFLSIFIFGFQNCSHSSSPSSASPGGSGSSSTKVLGLYEESTVTRVQFHQGAGDVAGSGKPLPQLDILIDWPNKALAVTITDYFTNGNSPCSVTMPVQPYDFESLMDALSASGLTGSSSGVSIPVAGTPFYNLTLSINGASPQTYPFKEDSSGNGVIIDDSNSDLLNVLQLFGERATCGISNSTTY